MAVADRLRHLLLVGLFPSCRQIEDLFLISVLIEIRPFQARTWE